MKRLMVVFMFVFIIPLAYADEFSDSSTAVIQKHGLRKFDYESGADVIYLGKNVNSDAADGDADWIIFKYTYVSEQVTEIERKIGTWTGRSGLF